MAEVEKKMKLAARVEALEEKGRTNSTNSGKPPSSDGPDAQGGRRPLGTEKDEGKKRKAGGQPGHKGHQRAVSPPEDGSVTDQDRMVALGHDRKQPLELLLGEELGQHPKMSEDAKRTTGHDEPKHQTR